MTRVPKAAGSTVVLLLLLLLTCLSLTVNTCTAAKAPLLQTCAKLTSCSCRLDDGRVVDLSPIQASPGPAFQYNAPDGYEYQYNPCGAYKCGDENDAAVCQEKLVIIPQFVDFGTQTSAQFDNDPSTGNLRLRYLSHDMSKTSYVNLICDPQGADAVSTNGADQGSGQLTLDLRSRHACPTFPGGSGGMSTGDILLIVFFVSIVLYLVGGILFNRFVRHQTGLGMVPNAAVWTSLPGLVADGSAFVYEKARGLLAGKRQGYQDVK